LGQEIGRGRVDLRVFQEQPHHLSRAVNAGDVQWGVPNQVWEVNMEARSIFTRSTLDFSQAKCSRDLPPVMARFTLVRGSASSTFTVSRCPAIAAAMAGDLPL